MKKLMSMLLTLTLCLSLAACGGAPDRQPAIDAFNKANNAFKEATAIINENLDTIEDETYDIFVEFNDLIAQHKALLEGEDELTQEELDEMIAWYAEVEQWSKDAKADLEANLAAAAQPEETGEPETTGTLLDYITPAYVPEGLAGTGWEFAGGFWDGAEMDDAAASEILAQYGGTLQIVFDSETEASMVQGGGAMTGTYTTLDDNTRLGFAFDNAGTELKYGGMFTDIDGTAVLILLPDGTYMNALYFTQILEG